MKKEIKITLDEELLKEFEDLAEQENLERSVLMKKVLLDGLHQERINFALQKYMLKEISMERAAEIAKISIHEFMLKASQLGISSQLSLEEYQKLLE